MTVWTRAASRWLEPAVLAVLLVLAALLRLPGIDQRGQWDSDQGHEMTVLANLVQHGQWPLLGPVTSVGSLHHGALYYYLLAPAALVSGADPVAVLVEIALLGVAAVAATWWLARLVGGPAAAAVAGLLLAVSPAAISESTFIWNPNPIPLFAALAVGGAIQARRTGASRWWLLAAAGTMATMQMQLVSGVLLIPVAGMWAWELRRRRRAGLGTALHLWAGLAGVAVLLAGYLPLLAHELTGDASETRALIAYLTGGGIGSGSGSSGSLPGRVMMVAVRALTWPEAGLLTDRVGASLVALVAVVGLGAAALVPAALVARIAPRPAGLRSGPGSGQPAVRPASPDGDTAPAPRWPAAWLLATLVVSIPALAVLAPSLAVVTPGLPNDHYHAFLDPIVVALVAAGAVRLAGLSGARPTGAGLAGAGLADAGLASIPSAGPRLAGSATAAAGPRLPAGARLAGSATGAAGPRLPAGLRLARSAPAAAGLTALGLVAVTAWPPAVSPDGGWRLADAAAGHIAQRVNAGWPPDEPRVLVSLPSFKPDDALRFPLTRHGMALQPPLDEQAAGAVPPVGVVIVVCDPLFNEVTGAPCGSLAEDAWLSDAYPPSSMQLVERFRAGSRRVVSVYAPSRLAAMP